MKKALLVLLISAFLTRAAAAGYTPLCRSGSGTAQCTGGLNLSSGGFGVPVDAGLTSNYVAIVVGGVMTIGPLLAAALPNHSAALLTSGTLSASRLPIIPQTLGGFGVDVSATSGLTPGYHVRVASDGHIVFAAIPNGDLPAAGGDLSGSLGLASVVKIQGYAVDTAAPADQQALVWQAGSSKYVPASIPAASGLGTCTISAISDTAGTAGQAAKRVVATGHVAVATGNATSDPDLVIGVYNASVAIAGTATIVKTGCFWTSAGLTTGKLFRKTDGTLVGFGSLTSGDYTNYMGVASSTGLDVAVSEGIQVP